jgi:hypothetical protein
MPSCTVIEDAVPIGSNDRAHKGIEDIGVNEHLIIRLLLGLIYWQKGIVIDHRKITRQNDRLPYSAFGSLALLIPWRIYLLASSLLAETSLCFVAALPEVDPYVLELLASIIRHHVH